MFVQVFPEKVNATVFGKLLYLFTAENVYDHLIC